MPDIDSANAPSAGDQDTTSGPTSGANLGVDPKLLEILVCPLTKQPLRLDRERAELVSEAGKLAFPIRQGVPIMLVDEARALDTRDPDPVASGAEALGGRSKNAGDPS
jgi:hypothetical protein